MEEQSRRYKSFKDLDTAKGDPEFHDRDVQVEDIRDVNELLKLPDPLQPKQSMLLMGITLDTGRRVEPVSVADLQQLKPTKLRPAIFHWRDMEAKTRTPKFYDDLIQRLLNVGPAEMEDLCRANWQAFDTTFYFRLSEMKLSTQDDRLKEKIQNLEILTTKLIRAAEEQMRKTMPDGVDDSKAIISSMIESGDVLLWPLPPEAYGRLAKEIERRAIRNKYEDLWFENQCEMLERFAKTQQPKGEKGEAYYFAAQVALQRLVTEWLRHDSLWEETVEGRFIFKLMNLSHEQWDIQLELEAEPMTLKRLVDEIKIISETKVVRLPMATKLQIYTAKYLQGLVEFFKTNIKDSETELVMDRS